MKDMFKGIAQAFYVTFMILVVLFTFARLVQADETVRINEWDRSIKSSEHSHGDDALVDMFLIMSADSAPTAPTWIMEENTKRRCDRSNELYDALKASMDAQPEYADTFEPAYQAIEEARCE